MNRGYTFIEILVVILLMSLITGIFMIYFTNSLTSARFRSTAKELAATIKYAKNLAMQKKEAQVINFNLDNKTYSMAKKEAKIIPPEIVLSFRETLDDARPVNAGKCNITYDSTGGNNWEYITLTLGQKSIIIKSDPVRTAVITEVEK